MTQPNEPSGTHDSEMRTVDEVVHDARDLSGHLRPPTAGDDHATALPDATAYAAADLPTVHEASEPAQIVGAASPRPGQPAAAVHADASGGQAAGDAAAHADASGGHDAHDDHGGDHAAHDDPRDPHLGPPDTAAWMAGALGALIALLMAVCFALAVGVIPTT